MVNSYEYDMERRRDRGEELIKRLLLREEQIKIGCTDDQIVWIWEGHEEMKTAVLLAVDLRLISIFARCGYSDDRILEKLGRSPLGLSRMFKEIDRDMNEFISQKNEMQQKGMSPEEIIAEFENMRAFKREIGECSRSKR